MNLALPTCLCLLAATVAAQTPLEGVVKETTNTTTYTYVRLERKEGETWLAGPRTPLRVGDHIRTAPGMRMTDFPSPSLKRTFPEIWFVGSIQAQESLAAAPEALPPGHPPLPTGAPADPHATLREPQPGLATGVVARAEGGLTVAEVHAQAEKWAGQVVRVRGRVAKVNRNILARHWLHLQDGSGAPGQNDLTVTTLEDAKPGEWVTVEAKVGVNRDMGSGYRYAVLLEEAKLTREAAAPATPKAKPE
jgi:hypothetical protein